ncbi:hypothetical protein AZE42_12038 [Rhizopogon vesiculosus]|uniref:Uncharacterized protein n=1 Tax=Rhizopogon vesiculosus TaxID=180088 RepID=A0A1J8Q671_9AGAM|nr:hypothetical protein AZE42_12038 [Rhizopogon vesiculosus]
MPYWLRVAHTSKDDRHVPTIRTRGVTIFGSGLTIVGVHLDFVENFQIRIDDIRYAATAGRPGYSVVVLQVSLSSSITAAERNPSGTIFESAKHWTDGFLENLKRGRHQGRIDGTARIEHLHQGPRAPWPESSADRLIRTL